MPISQYPGFFPFLPFYPLLGLQVPYSLPNFNSFLQPLSSSNPSNPYLSLSPFLHPNFLKSFPYFFILDTYSISYYTTKKHSMLPIYEVKKLY